MRFCTLLFCASIAFGVAFDTTITVTRAAEGVYVFSSGRDGHVRNLNSIAVVNEADVLIFDTNTRPATTRAVLAELRKITDKPVRWIVNSHWHPDHWSGNEVYAAEFPGVTIISTEETRDYMRNIAPAWPEMFAGRLRRMQQEATDSVEDREAIERYTGLVADTSALKRVYPNVVYRDRMNLHSGARRFELLSMCGDATASTVLYLPKEKTVLIGDLLAYPTQWGAQGSSLSAWIDSLHRLDAMDIETIVAGHGPVMHDKKYLRLVIELFETARKQVRELLLGGMVELADVQKAVKLGHLRPKFEEMAATFTTDCVRMAYLEARDGMNSVK
jgi:glyoxylase-like metal-dependent hydrolase (beta-lactamase superfamily II)